MIVYLYEMKKILLLLFIIISINIFPQIEYVKWGKKEVSYEINSKLNNHNYSLINKNLPNIFVKSLLHIYWIFISDVDGDNCSFQPSCSSFFIEAVDKTNIIKATLMFADRFTRDANIIDKNKNYPLTSSNKLFDPVYNYTLHNSLITVFSINNLIHK